MGNEIILVLNRREFDDDYSEKELWQAQAAKKLVEALTQTAKQARTYKAKRIQLDKNHKLQAIHDAIFVSGSRGAGKSVFLRNAKAIWERDYAKRTLQEEKFELYFCDEIDPTLLVNHDNFANVIIAHLYNAVEDKLSHLSGRNDIADHSSNFYEALKNLANALGNAEHNDSQLTGIDRIIGYRSGIQLEKYFHAYAEQCTAILKVDAIVIPIDDVDMALNRAFEVLDVVRRLLGCPFIIPVVSGDELLFRPILDDHFSKLGKGDGASVLDKEQASQLTQAYLTKVFQSQLRVVLQPVERLLKQLSILENEDKDKVTYQEYKKLINENFYALTNGEEKSQYWPEPVNAREVSLLVQTLPPFLLQNGSVPWEAFKTWAYVKQHGAAYTNAVSVEQFIELEGDGRNFSLSKLLSFNPLLQAEDYDTHWKEKDFRSEQESCLRDLGQIKDEDKGVQEYNYLLDVFKGRKILRSMPPVEYYLARLSVANIKEKPERENLTGEELNRALILAAFYTHKDYYGKAQALRSQVFFSRAFDFISTSLLLSHKRSSEDSKKFWRDLIDNLCVTSPFYTASAITPTKSISIDLADEDEPKEESETEFVSITVGDNIADNDKADFEGIVDLLVRWERSNTEFLSAIGQASLLPLLHSVFNKVFTQLHLMRADSKNIFVDDYLSDVAKRFEYIVLNAFASFLKPDKIVQTNIARTRHVSTIRNETKFTSSDNAYSGNVVGYLKNETPVEYVEQQKLLEIIRDHPLFTLVGRESAPLFSLLHSDKQKGSSLELVKNTKPRRGYVVKALVDVRGMNLGDLISALEPDKIKEAFELLEESVKELKIVGKKIKDCTKKDQKCIDWLNQISKGEL
jgi:hypothetical protein